MVELFWLGVGLAIVLVLLAAWVFDRQSRRRGHQVRSGGDIYRDVREQKRDNRAGDTTEYLNQDQSWTHRSRQDKQHPSD
jgi:membrane protein implicated in regulation of membrane protease activity